MTTHTTRMRPRVRPANGVSPCGPVSGRSGVGPGRGDAQTEQLGEAAHGVVERGCCDAQGTDAAAEHLDGDLPDLVVGLLLAEAEVQGVEARPVHDDADV